MAAPDLETLLDFETNVEDAAQAFLSDDTGLATSSINLTLDQDDLVLPRVEVMFELGEALDPPDLRSTGSALLEYRKYSGTLTVMVKTRATKDGSETEHRSIRAKVRSSLLLNADNWSTVAAGNSIVITGAGTSQANDIYAENGTNDSKPKYTRQFNPGGGFPLVDVDILWSNDLLGTPAWIVFNNSGFPIYTSFDDVATPDLVTTWSGSGTEPFPTVRFLTILPYYDVNYLRPTGTTYDPQGNHAISTLTYAMNLCIRNDAWPA